MGNEFRVNDYTFSLQVDPDVLMFPDGRFVVAWTSRVNEGNFNGRIIAGQLYDSFGARIGNNFVFDARAGVDYSKPHMALLNNGTFVIAYEATIPTESVTTDIFYRIYNSDLTEQTTLRLRADTGFPEYDRTPHVVPLGDGGFMILTTVLGAGTGFSTNVFARAFDADGTPRAPAFQLNVNASDNEQMNPFAVQLSNGNVVVIWDSEGSGISPGGFVSLDQMRAAVLNQNGAVIRSDFVLVADSDGVRQEHNTDISITALSGGGFAISWHGIRELGSGELANDILWQRFDNSANPTSAIFTAVSQVDGRPDSSEIIQLADGNILITWDAPNTLFEDTFGRIFALNGTPLTGRIVFPQNAPSAQEYPATAAFPDGGFVVAYESDDIDQSSAGIAARIIGRGTIGNDTITGDTGANILSGGPGADILFGGAGNDTLIGGQGGDALFGGSGVDRAVYHDAAAGLIADLILSGRNTGEAAGDSYNSIELLFGTGFADELRGTQSNNVIAGRNGNDSLYGRAGHDDLFGGNGNDTLDGGAGADDLFGGSGIDRALYTTANTGVVADLILSSRNTGDAAGDTYRSIELLFGSAFSDELRGTQTNNVIVGNGGNDRIYGRGGDDDIYGGAGNDLFDGGLGRDDIFGGTGVDGVLYNLAGSAVIADLILNNRNTGEATGDTYQSIEIVYGSAFADELRGTQTHNVLVGNNGSDRLYGRGGDDDIYGGNGNDQLDGGAGGDDLFGGTGIDRVLYNTASSGVTADLILSNRNTGDAAGDTYSSIELVYGSAFDDELRGTQTNNLIVGNGGADRLYGRGGNDDIYGGNGSDFIDSGAGRDEVFGGAGDDQFVFRAGDGADVIYDFTDNADTLVLDDALWTGTRSVAQVIDDFAALNGATAIFDFGGGNTISVRSAGSLTVFVDDITII